MNKMQVPKEIAYILDDAEAAEQARDAAVKGFFRFQVRNAVYLGKIAIQKRREFWHKIYELYPELVGKSLSFDRRNMTLSEQEATHDHAD